MVRPVKYNDVTLKNVGDRCKESPSRGVSGITLRRGAQADGSSADIMAPVVTVTSVTL